MSQKPSMLGPVQSWGIRSGLHLPLTEFTYRFSSFRGGRNLSCVPTAADAAARMFGVVIPQEVIQQAKDAEQQGRSRSRQGTDPNSFFRTLNALQRQVRFTPQKVWGHKKVTFRQIVQYCRKEGIRYGVVTTRTPSHAWAVEIQGDSVMAVDNGGFPQWKDWQGTNINGFYAVCPFSEAEVGIPPQSAWWGGATQAAPATTAQAQAVIRLQAQENPKKEGTPSHERFALYRDGMTVAEYLEAGGWRSDLRWDSKREYIRID